MLITARGWYEGKTPHDCGCLIMDIPPAGRCNAVRNHVPRFRSILPSLWLHVQKDNFSRGKLPRRVKALPRWLHQTAHELLSVIRTV